MSERKNLKFTTVGQVQTKKSGDGVTVKITNDVTLKKGQYLTVRDPRQRKGITQEQLDRIPDYVKHELTLIEEV